MIIITHSTDQLISNTYGNNPQNNINELNETDRVNTLQKKFLSKQNNRDLSYLTNHNFKAIVNEDKKEDLTSLDIREFCVQETIITKKVSRDVAEAEIDFFY